MPDSLTDHAVAIPVLPSANLDETLAFYIRELGFAGEKDDESYALLRRDSLELHFWLTDRPELCTLSSCYIRGGQIRALHAEYVERGVPGLSALEVRPWNMLEFHIVDPHGNLLRFGCIPGDAA